MKNYLSDEECREFTLPYARYFAVEMAAESASAMGTFYADYRPRIYKRQYGLFGMWKQRIYPDGRGYCVETKYSTEFFRASHRSDGDVFAGPFLEGYHGGPQSWYGRNRTNVPKMSPSPWQLIEKFFNSYSL